MARASYNVSAPGSLMLFGEHAVLRGRRALVAAVNWRMRVTLTPRSDRELLIHSALGEYRAPLARLTPAPAFRFVLAAVGIYRRRLRCGFDLTIASDFSDQVGLGSSAAVTVATLAVLQRWLEEPIDLMRTYREATRVVRRVQTVGSGADVAASVFGGIVQYRARPLEIVPLRAAPALVAVYSGSKEPTVNVIRQVAERCRQAPRFYRGLFNLMDECSTGAAAAIRARRWRQLGEWMNRAQGLMDALGVNNRGLSEIIYDLRSDPGILGAKISGSGLGDCAIGLGRLRVAHTDWPVIPVRIARRGVRMD